MSHIGLKYDLKRQKGQSVRNWLRELRYSIGRAWSRAWVGYDYSDILNVNDNFRDRMLQILRVYKKDNLSLFVVPENVHKFVKIGYINSPNILKTFSEEETDCILDVMIDHLEMMDENHVCEVLYGENWYDSDVKVDVEKVWRIQDQNKKLFFDLFEAFYWQLWY